MLVGWCVAWWHVAETMQLFPLLMVVPVEEVLICLRGIEQDYELDGSSGFTSSSHSLADLEQLILHFGCLISS